MRRAQVGKASPAMPGNTSIPPEVPVLPTLHPPPGCAPSLVPCCATTNRLVPACRPCLSAGGQKARLALARAAYSQAEVQLLDDPLSAVDPRVGRILFAQCIGPGGVMSGKLVSCVHALSGPPHARVRFKSCPPHACASTSAHYIGPRAQLAMGIAASCRVGS